MPPVSPQGSRTGLVAWSVTCSIVAVIAMIFAIYFYVAQDKATKQYDDYKKKYIPEIISDADLTSQEVADLKSIRGQEGSGTEAGEPVFKVAIKQRNDLAHMVGGPAANETGAVNTAKKALAQAATVAKDAGLTVPTENNLALAMTTLAEGLRTRLNENKSLQQQFADAKQQNANQVKQFDVARAEMAKTIEQIRAEQQKTQKSFAEYQGQKNTSVGEIEKAREQERAAAQEAANKSQAAIAERDQKIVQLEKDKAAALAKFAELRVNTKDPITRRADGHIIRIPSKDTVYIDLGSTESVTPGLTFEVYDKVEGVPPTGDPSTEEKLPRGKASIEVVRVGTNSSECRVVRTTPGTQITEGDLIANLVFDPNVKYVFMVYGDFDLDRNNIATPQEGDIIRRLITQWGGKLSDQINVDTDFVVLGKEPVVPTYTKEELQDPFNAKRQADAQAAADAYAKIKQTAIDLHIPVLNQNRFLYLIGYYDQARRVETPPTR